MSLLEQAEDLLARRDCVAALVTFSAAERSGADADRCAGGRWMAQMLLGDYAAAWRESDAIQAREAEDPHRFWQGEPIDGQRVMVRCLRGYGDTVMNLRWLPELRRRCREVVVQVCPEMLELVRAMESSASGEICGASNPTLRAERARRMGHTSAVAGFKPTSENPDVGHTPVSSSLCPVRVVEWTAEGASDREMWDVQVESAELPYLFRATTASLPAPARFRFAEEDLHHVRMRLGQRTKPRVGLVWTGSLYDPQRSAPFGTLLPLLRNRSVEFWSLQAEWDDEAWRNYCADHGWSPRTCYTPGRESTQDLVAMAAFASEMDLVITIDTMAAHVAGSLGLPTWVLLKREADWRWMLDRDDSPWYPTMRLFRQSLSGEWHTPFTRVCDALRDFCEEMHA